MSAHALPRLDLPTLDDAWAAVAALDGKGQTEGERAALKASLECIERLGARPGWGAVYQRDEIPVDYEPGKRGRPPQEHDDPYGRETMEETRARWKRNLERAGHDGEWLGAK